MPWPRPASASQTWTQTKLAPPEYARQSPTAAELWLRLLFSALVDADYLDTERHFNQARTEGRGYTLSIPDLWDRFQTDQRRLMVQADGSPVNQVRHQIYKACLEAAALPPGIFRLTVPTGGGKTRSAMAFALRHSSVYGHRRVIVAVPFTSITQQTAQVYREIFQSADQEDDVVLEHHSMVATAEGVAPR